jgi:hypothetical protein
MLRERVANGERSRADGDIGRYRAALRRLLRLRPGAWAAREDPSTPFGRAHHIKKYYAIVLVLIILLALGPFASAILASVVANSAGCTLNEAGTNSCIIHGHDYGETLYTMGMSFGMIIFTLPLAEFAFLLWVVVLAIHLVSRRGRRSRTERQA